MSEAGEYISTAILGKSGVGKTFFATHLAMALDYVGVKTLLVGCDQKRDTLRAVSAKKSLSLTEALERCSYEYGEVDPEEVIVTVSNRVDVIELGPSQLLVGRYETVIDAALQFFEAQGVAEKYQQVIFDVTDERFDGALSPLLQRVDVAIAVTDESAESFFVMNRLMRAINIGGYEFGYPMILLGAANMRSHDPRLFDLYTDRINCFPLLTVPEIPELFNLRHARHTLFAMESPPRNLDRIMTDFVNIADLLRGGTLNVYPVQPLSDDEIWRITAPDALPAN